MLDNRSKIDQSNFREYFEVFQTLAMGETMLMPISCLTPSQRDDGIINDSPKPIPVYFDHKTEKIILVEGNHRYYTYKRKDPNACIVVQKSPNINYY